jgi:hypothetical protein
VVGKVSNTMEIDFGRDTGYGFNITDESGRPLASFVYKTQQEAIAPIPTRPPDPAASRRAPRPQRPEGRTPREGGPPPTHGRPGRCPCTNRHHP